MSTVELGSATDGRPLLRRNNLSDNGATDPAVDLFEIILSDYDEATRESLAPLVNEAPTSAGLVAT